MYPRRFSQNVVLNKPNLKKILSDNGAPSYNKYSFMKQTLPLSKTLSNLKDVATRIHFLVKNAPLYRSLQNSFEAIPKNFKKQSSTTLKVWAHQCECVIAQRLRRGQQMFCLYSRLWEHNAFKEFLQKFRYQMTRRGREFILGSLGVTAYNWEDNRIPDSILEDHLDALEYVYLLKQKTICQVCAKDGKKQSKSICACEAPGKISDYQSYDNWEPFIEENDIIVWRREHAPGLYEYKVYGTYADVTAEDFLNVQIDTDYRRKWDATAVVLEVVEKDPVEESNSDVIYWEMLWPRMFTNRDYVFHRKFVVDTEKKTILIASKTTEHPACPKKPNRHRVEDYWSYMVIKPDGDLDKPGIEFVLTYFDNPGMNIPGAVTTWVAYRAMPDFLERLREASKKYKLYCKQQGMSAYCQTTDERFKRKKMKDVIEIEAELPYCDDDDVVTDNTIYEPQHTFSPKRDEPEPESKKCRKRGEDDTKEALSHTVLTPEEVLTSPSPMIQGDTTYWKYLKPMYYFS